MNCASDLAKCLYILLTKKVTNIKCKQPKFQINTKHVTQIGITLRRNDNYYIYFVVNDHIITIQLEKRKFMALFF